ncbi:unnamed protein product, partial [Gulo gulo]
MKEKNRDFWCGKELGFRTGGDWGEMLKLIEDSGNGAIFQEAAGEWAREGPLQEAA